MEDWLGCVWEQPGALSKPWSMLVMDAFNDRLSDRTINRLRNKNAGHVIIPSGMTAHYNHLVCQVTNHSGILSINTVMPG
jgi:hypothetical protein